MILDPNNRYIQAIQSQISLTGATLLEIGCGAGRMTRDMAHYAQKITATDLDNNLLIKAKKMVSADNVEFIHTPNGIPDLPAETFDIVIYTLSLHHIPKYAMRDHLIHSGSLLKKNGSIIVIEPGNGGSFLDIKKRFGAGSGDEGPEKAAAADAIKNLAGWVTSPTYTFDVEFLFTDHDDFFANKLPNYHELTTEMFSELQYTLDLNTTADGIILTSERHLNVLKRAECLAI